MDWVTRYARSAPEVGKPGAFERVSVRYFTFVRRRTGFRFFRLSAGALSTGAVVLRKELHLLPAVVGRAFAACPGLLSCLVRVGP